MEISNLGGLHGRNKAHFWAALITPLLNLAKNPKFSVSP